MSQWPTITELVEEVKSGKVSAAELVDKSLFTIDSNKDFDAVISLTSERAKERALDIDEKIKNNQPVGRLAGIPFIAKDNMLTFGSETTAASNILKGFNAPYQSTAIELLEAEGAICVAKSNLDAFAHGSSTENSDFMITKNPNDPKHVPGGSSGGSAAAVILDMAPFALGTDTGGSIRLPASFCGAVGLKPTYGLVSRYGVVAMASSHDVIGPLTRNIEDAAYVLDIIAGKDIFDSTTIDRDETSYAKLDDNITGKKVGIIKEYLDGGVDEPVKKKVEECIEKLKATGVIFEEVSLPSLPLALSCYYILCPAELSSNLSRYDGQRYGYSSKDAKTLDESYNWSRSEGFGQEAKRRIMIGTYVLSSGYYDAYYKQAQKLRTKIIKEFDEAFSKFDFLIGPTAPGTAFKIGANVNDPLQMYLTDIMTVAANLSGVPAISIPAGKFDNLPIGLQLMADQKHDRELLGFASGVEKAIS
jgi:aspartyl-tRNA(Asn)/glutamyl-tRNA(Gln) amidotransferase subunit A